MRLKKFMFIYEIENEADELDRLINVEPDAIEYSEEGYIDLDSVVGASRANDDVNVYTLGGHIILLECTLEEFMQAWLEEED